MKSAQYLAATPLLESSEPRVSVFAPGCRFTKEYHPEPKQLSPERLRTHQTAAVFLLAVARSLVLLGRDAKDLFTGVVNAYGHVAAAAAARLSVPASRLPSVDKDGENGELWSRVRTWFVDDWEPPWALVVPGPGRLPVRVLLLLRKHWKTTVVPLLLSACRLHACRTQKRA